MHHVLCSLLTTSLLGCVMSGRASTGPASAPPGSPSSSDGYTPEPSSAAPDAEYPPGRWSLAERQAWTVLRDEMLGSLRDANERCGSSIHAEFDHESFRGMFLANERYGLDAYGRAHVQVVLDAITNICKVGEREKRAVAAGIRTVTFVHGRRGGNAKSTIQLVDGAVAAVIEPVGEAAGRWQDEIQKYLETQL